MSPPSTTSVGAIVESPIAQFLFGLGLFYGVQKFFKEVEEKLNEDTKIAIWLWLAELRRSESVRVWPATFASAFDSLFGAKHLSWRCFSRSTVASGIIASAFYLFPSPAFHFEYWYEFVVFPLFLLIFNALPDYVSLLETRSMLRWMERSRSPLVWLAAILLDLWLRLYIASVPASVVMLGDAGEWREALDIRFLLLLPLIGLTDTPQNRFIVFPALFTSAWVWLYAICGYFLKAARALDVGFVWISRRLDVENKRLQSMGLISGTFCALIYWGAASFRR